MKRKNSTEDSQSKIINLNSLLSSKQLQNMLMNRAQNAAMALGVELLEQEVQSLCGAPFSRKGEEFFHRGGSDQTSIILDGVKYPIKRPRVRGEDGEVELQMLGKLKDNDLFDSKIQDRIIRGITTRNYEDVISSYSEKTGVSKSSVSRAFVRASQARLNELNDADLSGYRFVALMIDGVEFAGRSIIVALGVTDELEKVPLGIREGDTENAEVIKDLLASIMDRKFKQRCEKILAVLDGGKALKKAVKNVFGSRVIIQRCWLHKLRNLKTYVPKRNHPELLRRMKMLMNLTQLDEALKELTSFICWLSSLSLEAEASMKEVGKELLVVHELGLPKDLRDSLSSTNCVESLIGVVRDKTDQVKNWKSKKGYHITRWVASAILDHRKNMHRLRGCNQSKILISALGDLGLETKQKIA